MTFPNFDALAGRLVELFQSQQYAEALALANREGPNFPDDRPLADYWRMCAAARVGDRAQLFRVADQALADGLWYGEYLWRQTPSFAPLQGDADFEQLIERSRAAQRQDPADAGPVLLTRAPTGHSAASPLLVALHGNQGTAEATLPGTTWPRRGPTCYPRWSDCRSGCPTTPVGWWWPATPWAGSWRSAWRCKGKRG
jgi:hypothetical protein